MTVLVCVNLGVSEAGSPRLARNGCARFESTVSALQELLQWFI